MTECDHKWKAVPGASHYENCPGGHVRSLPRDKNGRTYPGTYPEPMKLREDGDGYLVFNYTDDDGVRHTNASVARVTLMTHDPAWRPWLQACHGPGGQKDNRFPENIRTDTADANRQEALELRMANNPPKPKPLKVCVRCGAAFDAKGRRCPPCIDWFAQEGAQRLAGGMDLEAAARELDYPSPIGLLRLAVKHAGLRFVIEPPHIGLSVTTENGKSAAVPVLVYDEVNAAMLAAGHRESPWRRLRRVLIRRGPSRQNSDAQ